jgi:hypothetical protein
VSGGGTASLAASLALCTVAIMQVISVVSRAPTPNCLKFHSQLLVKMNSLKDRQIFIPDSLVIKLLLSEELYFNA